VLSGSGFLTGWSLARRSPTDYDAWMCVIKQSLEWGAMAGVGAQLHRKYEANITNGEMVKIVFLGGGAL